MAKIFRRVQLRLSVALIVSFASFLVPVIQVRVQLQRCAVLVLLVSFVPEMDGGSCVVEDRHVFLVPPCRFCNRVPHTKLFIV